MSDETGRTLALLGGANPLDTNPVSMLFTFGPTIAFLLLRVVNIFGYGAAAATLSSPSFLYLSLIEGVGFVTSLINIVVRAGLLLTMAPLAGSTLAFGRELTERALTDMRALTDIPLLDNLTVLETAIQWLNNADIPQYLAQWFNPS